MTESRLSGTGRPSFRKLRAARSISSHPNLTGDWVTPIAACDRSVGADSSARSNGLNQSSVPAFNPSIRSGSWSSAVKIITGEQQQILGCSQMLGSSGEASQAALSRVTRSREWPSAAMWSRPRRIARRDDPSVVAVEAVNLFITTPPFDDSGSGQLGSAKHAGSHRLTCSHANSMLFCNNAQYVKYIADSGRGQTPRRHGRKTT